MYGTGDSASLRRLMPGRWMIVLGYVTTVSRTVGGVVVVLVEMWVGMRVRPGYLKHRKP